MATNESKETQENTLRDLTDEEHIAIMAEIAVIAKKHNLQSGQFMYMLIDLITTMFLESEQYNQPATAKAMAKYLLPIWIDVMNTLHNNQHQVQDNPRIKDSVNPLKVH